MAGGSLLALFDDITSMTKIVAKNAATALDDTALATKKAAGVVIDDAAVVPQYAEGIQPHRELPMVGKMAWGSFLNKVVLVPTALAASVFAPWSIPIALGLGGAFLCYEGVESAIEKWIPKSFKKKFGLTHEHSDLEEDAHITPSEKKLSAKEFEDKKVKSAIKTDFILSAEIIVIALGSVMHAPIMQQFISVATAGLLVTAGVYGVVAGIVKMDDIGLHMIKKGIENNSPLLQKFGKKVVDFMPKLMNGLSHAGTFAMLAVGGGIFGHHLHHVAPGLSQAIEATVHAFGPLGIIPEWTVGAIIGTAIGAVAIPAVNHIISPVWEKVSKPLSNMKNKVMNLLSKTKDDDCEKPEKTKTAHQTVEINNEIKNSVKVVKKQVVEIDKPTSIVKEEAVVEVVSIDEALDRPIQESSTSRINRKRGM